MPISVSTSSQLPRSLLWAVVGAGFLLAAAMVLLGYYGTAVFYEVILAGLALCF